MRRWPVLILLALAPLWLVTLFGRGAWMPDEPRETDIAWRMSHQSDWTLPQLAGEPFLEKPPLSYWMAAGSMRLFGDSPRAARAPNLLYAVITVLALAALGYSMRTPRSSQPRFRRAGDGPAGDRTAPAGSAATQSLTAPAATAAATATSAAITAGVTCALTAATAVIPLRVSAWLAPDAALLAGCALALLGAFLGYRGQCGRPKLMGYTLMHVGALIGFMAKSAPGWLLPALTLTSLIVWERRWRELYRWELYAGLLLQILVIGPWIVAVARSARGGQALDALFWHNTVGRFTRLSGPAALDYTSGHRNSPGKYLLELPVYLLPWTLLAAAALRRAAVRIRVFDEAGTAWRFAICSIVPFLALISLAATARDIYAAPGLLGFSLLAGLWASEAGGEASPPPWAGLAAVGTVLISAVLGCTFIATLVFLSMAEPDPAERALLASAAAAIVLCTIVGARLALRAPRRQPLRLVCVLYASYACAVVLLAVAAFPLVDRWQDLSGLARQIDADTLGHPLALLAPDETTIAMLDFRLNRRFSTLDPNGSEPERAVRAWFGRQGADAYVLVKIPGTGDGAEMQLLRRLRSERPESDDGVATLLQNRGAAKLVRIYELPQGRRYALLGALHGPPNGPSTPSAIETQPGRPAARSPQPAARSGMIAAERRLASPLRRPASST